MYSWSPDPIDHNQNAILFASTNNFSYNQLCTFRVNCSDFENVFEESGLRKRKYFDIYIAFQMQRKFYKFHGDQTFFK